MNKKNVNRILKTTKGLIYRIACINLEININKINMKCIWTVIYQTLELVKQIKKTIERLRKL